MTPVGRLIKNAVEKLVGVYAEAAAVPGRFDDYITAFLHDHKRATRAEWARFASALAAEAYRDGYARAWERGERDPESLPTSEQIQEAAERIYDAEWKDLAPSSAELALDAEVPEELPPWATAEESDLAVLDAHRVWLEEHRMARGHRRI